MPTFAFSEIPKVPLGTFGIPRERSVYMMKSEHISSREATNAGRAERVVFLTYIVRSARTVKRAMRASHAPSGRVRKGLLVLQDRALLISWQNPWKILADFPVPVAVGEHDLATCSVWLRLLEDDVGHTSAN